MSITAAKLQVEVGADTKGLDHGLQQASQKVSGFGSDISKTALGVFSGQVLTAATRGIASLAGEAVQAYSDFERLSMSLETLTAKEMMSSGAASSMSEALGMAGPKAQELLKWIEQLAVKSPFTQEGVAQAFRMAQAYGFSSAQAQRLTSALIDFASGAGLGEDSMARIARALGQIQAKGKLAGGEVLQLTEAGLGVDAILAKAFGKSTSEIVDMREKGLIPAGAAIEAIVASLEKDFGGAAARASKSISGLVSSLQDIKTIGLREFFAGTAEAIQPFMQELVDTMNTEEFREKIRGWGESFGEFVKNTIIEIQTVIDWWGNLDESTQNTILVLGGMILLGPKLVSFFGTVVNGASLLVGLGPQIVAAISGISAGIKAWQAGMSLTTALGAAGLTPMMITLGAIALAVGAVVAVWMQWNKQIVETNKEGQAAVDNTWDKFFRDQVQSGKSAEQVLQEYQAANNRVHSQLEATNPVLRLFIENEKELYASTDQINFGLASASKSYEEYRDVATQAGLGTAMFSQQQWNAIAGSSVFIQNQEALKDALEGTADEYGAYVQQMKAAGMESMALSKSEWEAAKAAQQLGQDASFAKGGLDELTKGGMEAKDIMKIVAEELKNADYEAGLADQMMSDLGVTLEATSAQAAGMESDVRLLAQAYAEGVIPVDQFNQYMTQAKDGTLSLSDAQRDNYQASITQAQGMREATKAAQELQLNQLEVAQSMSEMWTRATESYENGMARLQEQQAGAAEKIAELQRKISESRGKGSGEDIANYRKQIDELTVSSQKAAVEMGKLADEMKRQIETSIASAGLDQLKKMFESGQMGFEDYVATVTEVQKSFGLTNETGVGIAAGLALIQKAFTDGKIPADQYAESLRLLSDDAQDGSIDLQALANALNTGLTPAAQTAGQAATDMGGAVVTGMSDAANAAIQSTQDIQQTISGVDWVGLGRNIGAGIAQGIRESIPDITAAAQEAAGAAETTTTGALQVQSPSRVFTRIGRDTMAGMTLGFRQETPVVERELYGSMMRLQALGSSASRPLPTSRTGSASMATTPVVPLTNKSEQPIQVTLNVANEHLRKVVVRNLDKELSL